MRLGELCRSKEAINCYHEVLARFADAADVAAMPAVRDVLARSRRAIEAADEEA